jgi:hypothetical protein
MELDRPLPHPMTPEARPFWEGLREQRLMLPACQDCGRPHFYPRVVCPFCHSRRIRWVQASGRGRLHTFAIAHQVISKTFRKTPPVVLAMVELEEGPRLLTNLVEVEADPAHIRCEMPVEVVYERLTEEVTLPLFRPVKGGAAAAGQAGAGPRQAGR